MNTRTDWNGNTTNLTNNSHGLPTQIVEAAGASATRTTTIAYDTAFPQLPDSIVTAGLTTGYTYDSTTGNVLTMTQTDTTANPQPARTWTNTYETLSGFQLLHTAKKPRTDVNVTTTYAYNSNGYVSSITDPLGHVAQITSYTSAGRPLTIVDANSVTTTLTYDYRQRLLTSSVATSGGARTTTLTYDAAGNLTKKLYPDASFFAYTYDAAHRMTKITDANSSTYSLTLNAAGQATAVAAADSSPRTRYVHSDSFDSIGRTLTDTAGTNRVTTYTYDGNGKLSRPNSDPE